MGCSGLEPSRRLEHPAMTSLRFVLLALSKLPRGRFCRSNASIWGMLLAFFLGGSAVSNAAVRVEAYRGDPFGIGRVTIDLQQGASQAPASDDRCTVVDEQDRVMYSVTENKSSRKVMRSLLGMEKSLRVTYLFLFRDDEYVDLVT